MCRQHSPRWPRICRWLAFPTACRPRTHSAAPSFRAFVNAREIGVAKPDAAIFHAACELLGVPAECVLHVGNDPRLDIAGAQGAGLCSAWLNRGGGAWSDGPAPDLEIRDLGELAAWILARTA
jgi:putative hydrolase of the HAD superfamily